MAPPPNVRYNPRNYILAPVPEPVVIERACPYEIPTGRMYSSCPWGIPQYDTSARNDTTLVGIKSHARQRPAPFHVPQMNPRPYFRVGNDWRMGEWNSHMYNAQNETFTF